MTTISSEPGLTGPTVTRRGVLVGTGLCALALGGCASYGPEEDPGGAGTEPAKPVEVAAGDIPVGGGKIFAEEKVVLTQPSSGTFKAFTAVCTHQGCIVASVTSTINCDCHGSQFSITDGSVVHDPAPGPLAELPVAVEGDRITVG